MNYWLRCQVRSSLIQLVLGLLSAWIQAVTPEEVQQHINTLLSKLHMRIAVIGNVYKDVC